MVWYLSAFNACNTPLPDIFETSLSGDVPPTNNATFGFEFIVDDLKKN